jgi:hypothetical protein
MPYKPCIVCGETIYVPHKFGSASYARHPACKLVKPLEEYLRTVPTEGTARSPRWGAVYKFFQDLQKSSTSG